MAFVKADATLENELLNFDPFFRWVEFAVDTDPPLSTWYAAQATWEVL